MKILTISESLDKKQIQDNSYDGIYYAGLINDILTKLVSDKSIESEDYIVINHRHFFESELSDIKVMCELLERIPNLILTNNDIKLLLKLKKKLKRMDKKILVASSRLTKGIDYFIYPRTFQDNSMVKDISRKANSGVGILLNGNNFRYDERSMLPNLNERLDNEESVIIYTKEPEMVLNMVRK